VTKPERSNRRWLWPLLTLAVAGMLVVADKWPGRRAGKPADEAGRRAVFEVWVGGKNLGQEQMLYDTDPEAGTARLTTSSKLTLPFGTMHVDSEADFSLPGLVLTRYRLTNTGRMSLAEFTLDRQDDHFRFTTGGSAGGRDSELPAEPGALLLDNNIAGHYQLLAWRWRSGHGGTLHCPVVVPQAGKVFEGTITPGATGSATLDGRQVVGRCLDVTVGPLTAEVWLEEKTGELLRVVLHGEPAAEYRRVGLSDLPGGG